MSAGKEREGGAKKSLRALRALQKSAPYKRNLEYAPDMYAQEIRG